MAFCDTVVLVRGEGEQLAPPTRVWRIVTESFTSKVTTSLAWIHAAGQGSNPSSGRSAFRGMRFPSIVEIIQKFQLHISSQFYSEWRTVAERAGSRIAQATGGAGERGSRFSRAQQKVRLLRSLRAGKLGVPLVLARGPRRYVTLGITEERETRAKAAPTYPRFPACGGV
jgi:hypothetical protein